MRPTWSEDLPRLYEICHDSDTAIKENYFVNFEDALNTPCARKKYVQLEKDLQQLDENAWHELKQKAVKYVTTKDERRGYEQLFNTLSEVKGYLYLKSEGCTEVHFIPEKNTPTPDLYGRCGSSGIVMEVKALNVSDDELDWIRANSELRNGHMTAREVRNGLDDLLKGKVIKTINVAKEQLMSYACEGIQRRIVYLVIHLDILLALDPRNFDELEAYIEEQGNEKIEVMHCCRD